MHVKNHMAMWSLWFLWFLRVEYSGNQLYKPLCAFLVFVDLVWFLCGSCVGRFVVFGSIVVFGSGLRVLLLFVVFVARWSCHRCRRLRVHLLFVGRWSCPRCSMLDADDCASYCSLWFLWLGGLARIDARPLALCGLLKRFAHRPNS